MKRVGCFITPHGFGHASRAIAVLEALQRRQKDLHIRLLTTVPQSIFTQSLNSFSYHPVMVDVGLVQRSALEADLPATLTSLDRFLPFSPELTEKCTAICQDCDAILCDIAPLGIVVAEKVGIPSVLVENFTWHWLYQPYLQQYPQLADHCRYFRTVFARANYHIQTEPLCEPTDTAISCSPIFRPTRGGSETIRSQFTTGTKKLIVLTMGGIELQLPTLTRFTEFSDNTFVITGQNETGKVADNVFLIDRRSSLYHPDLIAAADAVICKAGYSSIAECYQAGTRVISVGREDFAETAPLQSFIRQELNGIPISPEAYLQSRWLELLPELLTREKTGPARHNGADTVARILHGLLFAD